ncbi:MAG: hypothetical protein JSU69_03075, partial [Candidatus Zixiibacteriota bacterium]
MEDFTIKTRRDFPSVEKLATDETVVAASEGLARPLVIEIIRAVIDEMKPKLGTEISEISYIDFKTQITVEIKRALLKKIGRVINGAGILV